MNGEKLTENQMPFTVGDLKSVYESLAELDGWNIDEYKFSQHLDKPASAVELSMLFDELTMHYKSSSDCKMGEKQKQIR